MSVCLLICQHQHSRITFLFLWTLGWTFFNLWLFALSFSKKSLAIRHLAPRQDSSTSNTEYLVIWRSRDYLLFQREVARLGRVHWNSILFNSWISFMSLIHDNQLRMCLAIKNLCFALCVSPCDVLFWKLL